MTLLLPLLRRLRRFPQHTPAREPTRSRDAEIPPASHPRRGPTHLRLTHAAARRLPRQNRLQQNIDAPHPWRDSQPPKTTPAHESAGSASYFPDVSASARCAPAPPPVHTRHTKSSWMFPASWNRSAVVQRTQLPAVLARATSAWTVGISLLRKAHAMHKCGIARVGADGVELGRENPCTK